MLKPMIFIHTLNETHFISIPVIFQLIITVFQKLIKKFQASLKTINKNIVKKEINFDDFYSCLFHKNVIKRKQIRFQSDKHHMYTIEQNKTALINFTDKRVYFNNIHSYAYGHYSLEQQDTCSDSD